MTGTIVEARLSWALVWMGVAIFVFALFWGNLDPSVGTMMDTSAELTNDTVDDNATMAAAQTGRDRAKLVWDYAPLWFGLGVLMYGFRRAINESQRTPGR